MAKLFWHVNYKKDNWEIKKAIKCFDFFSY